MPRTTLERPRGSRETLGSPAAALASVMTRAGINPMHEAADLQEALQRAIALHRYSCTWTQVPAGWVVALSFPERRRFFGTTLEEALAWCLAWVQARETRRSSFLQAASSSSSEPVMSASMASIRDAAPS
jgi:hypothetical protein